MCLIKVPICFVHPNGRIKRHLRFFMLSDFSATCVNSAFHINTYVSLHVFALYIRKAFTCLVLVLVAFQKIY